FVATVDREIMRDPKREVGYCFTDSWDEIVETLQGAPVSTDTELGRYARDFETRVRQDTNEIYMRRQTVTLELLRIDHRRSTEITELKTALQGQVTALQGQELSDIGTPRADDHENLMLPEMLEDPYVEVALQAPPSPDYIPGPEEPEQAPPSPDYIPGPEHADDEIVAEDASPIAQSPEYVPESDFEAYPEDDDDEDPEEDPLQLLLQQLLTRPHLRRRWSHLRLMKVVRLLAISSPPASPLSPWSSPPPQIPFPPLPLILSPPSPVLSPAPPPSPIRSLGYRAAMMRLRDEAASTSSPPLQLPSASRREDRPEVTLPPQKRLGIAFGPRYEVGERSSAAAARPARGLRAYYSFVATVDREIMRDPEREVGYWITDSWDEIVETLQGAPVSTDTELGRYVRDFETRVRQDTNEIYMRLEDEQTERQLLAGRLNMLFRDRRAHAYTRHLMETEARMSREAWVRATYASDLVHGEVMLLRTSVLGQMSEIRELQAADRRRQTVISELLRI
nr:hypothetical protein [Tanacetum cinerariifolium]